MDKFKRVNLVTSLLQGAYTAALVELHKSPPKNIDDDFSDLNAETRKFLLSLQKETFNAFDVSIEDFAIGVDPDTFIFDE